MNATSKLVKAWESKNAKNAAKAGGVSLMALSLAACGGSSETVDLTPFDQADIDAAVNTVTVDLTAVNDELTAANLEFETANGELITINVDLAADLDDAEDAVALLQATIDEIDADDLETLEALEALGVDGTLELDELLAAIAALNDDASFESGAASRDDEVSGLNDTVTGLNDTITAIDNTDAASEQEAFDDGAASRDDEVANLQAQIDALLAADAALDARTLDADNETFAAGDATDFDIIVSGTTADGDDLTATVTGSGTGTLSFTFADLDDVVTLTATDLSSYSSIVVTAGTVDLTAVTLGAGVNITINSGVELTAAQFLAAGTIDTDGDGEVTVTVSSAAEAQQVADAIAKMVGVTSENFTLVNGEGSTATDAEIALIEADADLALDVAAANEDPVGSITAAVASVRAEEALVDAANEDLEAIADAAELAAAQATLDLLDNELVAAEMADDDIAAIEEAIADEDTDAVEDIDGDNGDNLGAGLDAAIVSSVLALDLVLGPELGIDDASGRITDSDAIVAAYISDERDVAALEIENATTTLTDATAALDGTLLISRGEDVTAATAAAVVTDDNLTAAQDIADDAATVATAIINIDEDAATLDGEGSFDIDGGGALLAVDLFAVDADGVVSLDDAVITVNADDASDYDIAYVDGDGAAATATVTGSFIDSLLDAYQDVVDAVDADDTADDNVTAAEALFDAALDGAADDADLEFVDADAAQDAYDAYTDAIVGLADANELSDDLETAVSNYDTLVALEAALTALQEVATDAGEAADDGADEDALDAAIDAVENALDDEAPGLNVTLDDGYGDGNDYALAVDINDDIEVDTVAGLDFIDFGDGYTFTTVAADAVVDTDAVGDAAVLEVLLQQQSDEDGLTAGVSVWIEAAAADGSSSVTGDADFTINNADGDLALADLDLSVDGLIITGLYDAGLIV